MQLGYLYDQGLISKVIPAVHRKLLDIANAGLPQVVDVKETVIIRLLKLLDKRKTQGDIVFNKRRQPPSKPLRAFRNPGTCRFDSFAQR